MTSRARKFTEDPMAAAEKAIADAALAQRRDTVRAMAKRTLERVLAMAERALSRAERVSAKTLKRVPPPAPLACKANCPWCCHIRLTASPPEVLLVLDFVHRTFSAGDQAALRRKVANIDAFTRGRDGEARARQRLPCPLLKDGSCSVHAVRPLSCRATLSVDAGACKRSYDSHMEEPVPQLDLPYVANNAVGYGLHAGLADRGFPLEDLEMNAALAIGLADPEVGEKWVRGEPVLRPATLVRAPD